MKPRTHDKWRLVCIAILLLFCLAVPATSAEVTVQASQYFTVEYQFTEHDGASYWMFFNSKDSGKIADIPDADPVPIYNFKNAVDTCVFYETKFREDIALLATGGLSPMGMVTTIPALLDSWNMAKEAAEKADYYFEQI